jgi:hypothetical protein
LVQQMPRIEPTEYSPHSRMPRSDAIDFLPLQ